MMTIEIVNREMSSAEYQRSQAGFDEYSLDMGVSIQASVRFGFVAVDGQRFVGCSSGLAYQNGTDFSGWFNLTDLYVEPTYRLQGVGTQLLMRLEEQVAAVGAINMFTWTAGHEAPRFYEKQGYQIFAEMEDWYSDGGSRFGLRKQLKAW